jgi:hypothetical protein
LTHRKQGKAFFFEKKKQKGFVYGVADLARKVRVSTRKSFLVLFLEKGLLATSHGQGRLLGWTAQRHLVPKLRCRTATRGRPDEV